MAVRTGIGCTLGASPGREGFVPYALLQEVASQEPRYLQETEQPSSSALHLTCYLGEPEDCSFEGYCGKYTTLLAKFHSHFHTHSYPLFLLFGFQTFTCSYLMISVHIGSKKCKDSDASLVRELSRDTGNLSLNSHYYFSGMI